MKLSTFVAAVTSTMAGLVVALPAPTPGRPFHARTSGTITLLIATVDAVDIRAAILDEGLDLSERALDVMRAATTSDLDLQSRGQVEDRAIPVYIIFTYDEILDGLSKAGKRDVDTSALKERDVEDRGIPVYIIFTYDEILDGLSKAGKRDIETLGLKKRDVEAREIPVYIIFTYDEILEDINSRLEN